MVSYAGDLTCLPVVWLIKLMTTFVWLLKGSLWSLQWSLCTQEVTSSFIPPVRAHWAGCSILLNGRGVTTQRKPPHQCYYWSTKVFWGFFSFQHLPWYNLEIFCSDESLTWFLKTDSHTLIPSVWWCHRCKVAKNWKPHDMHEGCLLHGMWRFGDALRYFWPACFGLPEEVVHLHSSAAWCPNCSKVWNSKASSGTAALPVWQIYKPCERTVCHHIQKCPIIPENAENHECYCLGLKATVTLCEEFRCQDKLKRTQIIKHSVSACQQASRKGADIWAWHKVITSPSRELNFIMRCGKVWEN